MVTKLSNSPLKRYYRYNNNVIYSITKTKPTTDTNYLKYDDPDVNLPYLELTYGIASKGENGIISAVIDSGYKIKLYLDCYIETGDVINVKDGKYYFKAYLNNGEDDESPTTYMQIHEQEIEDDLKENILSGRNKEYGLNKVPYYCRKGYSVNDKVVYYINPQSVIVNGETKVVNCICGIELKNVYKNDDSAYTAISQYETNYKNFVIDTINSYIKNIAEELVDKQIDDWDNEYETQDVLKEKTVSTSSSTTVTNTNGRDS